ncbi:MAG: type II secretion system F family protein, partial [Thermoanaerobaculia bacterium]|nr:type II secretion system F family protein [Thermoanaerobaculia bacterium]
ELERLGYHVFAIRRGGLGLSWLLPSDRRPRRIPPRRLLIFNQELAALLRAGLPVLQALDLLLKRQRQGELKARLVDIRDRVESGASLSEAVAAQGEVFPPLYAPTLMAGERSGDLEGVIDRFVRYQRLVYEGRKKVASALVYPAVLVGLSAVLIGVMLFYVVPGFESFFLDLGTDLPTITRVIMGLSDLVTDYWVWWLVAIAVAAVVVMRLRATRRGGRWLDRLKLRVPVLGTVFHRFALSEYCRSLSTLLAGGTPLVGALGVASGAVSNSYIRERLKPVAGKVSEGAPFHRSLEETGAVPALAIDMAQVGEATGELGTMLGTVSDFLDEEVETALARILSLIEPIMLVLMGIIIATLLIAVYLPLSSALSTVR